MKKLNQLEIIAVCFVLILFHLPASYLNAASVRAVSMDELVQQSQFVFEGTVTGIEARENDRKRIHTYVTFKISEIVKGQYTDNVITLRFLGGTVGDNSMSVSDQRIPQVGEQGIYFVESLDRFQVNPLYGWSQGHFILERDLSGTQRVMTNRGLPVRGVIDNKQSNKIAADDENTQPLSNGVTTGIMVDTEKNVENGMKADDFKTILRQKGGNAK
jgi:hypothetical protein